MSETSVLIEFVCHLLKYFHTFNLHASCKMCGDKICTFQGYNTKPLLKLVFLGRRFLSGNEGYIANLLRVKLAGKHNKKYFPVH